MRRTPNTLERESERTTSANGLTLERITTERITFNLSQLKRACTADKMLMTGINREDALKVLSGLIRENRWELFGTCEGYKIITNGYGQFKEVQFSHGNPVKAETIFNKLLQLDCE